MKRALVVLLLALAGYLMLSRATTERRKQDRAILDDKWDDYVSDRIAKGRAIDIGVRLRCVVQDENGAELIPGKPRLRVVRERVLGGIIDRKRGVIVAPTRAPVTWYCSEDQWPVILHDDADPLGQLVYGSEGAGKTTALAMWHYCRWLENLGQKREGGQTAPTNERLTMVRDEMFRIYPASWFRWWKSKDIIRFCDGTKIRLRSTWKQSNTVGSPIQGYNWSWCGRDEGQDQVDRHADIEARGRSGPNAGATYKQCITATAKDSSVWRTFRDMLDAAVTKSGIRLWLRRTLLGQRSPFIAAEYWEKLKLVYSPREFDRRVLAKDVGVELAVYYGWERGRNLVARPQVATDVTAAIFADYPSVTRPGARHTIGVAHDPGNIFNTSVVFRLLMFGRVPTWVVVGELQTKQTTQRAHAIALKKYLQDKFSVEHDDDSDAPKALVFIDPHGRGETQTDYQTVYGAFEAVGFDCFSPAPTTHRIKRSARVQMINRLLTNAAGDVRLVVACDGRKQPLAPILIDAFETLEKKPGDDDPEGSQRKDESDKTHAPAALAYGLWMFEQESITAYTISRAIAAAARRPA